MPNQTGMIGLGVDFEGLDDLADAFANAPALVERRAREAGEEAAPVLLRHIRAETHKVTGFLRASQDVILQGPFNLRFEAQAHYAQAENARHPFVQPGVAAADDEITAIYERAIDRLAGDFTHGAQ